MLDRRTALRLLAVGDIFHARGASRPSLVCLVESVTDTRITARNVATSERSEFDRNTGISLLDEGQSCTIDSIAPLPVAIHNTILGLERKMRLQHDQEKHKLNREEIQALYFVDSYYRFNPL